VGYQRQGKMKFCPKKGNHDQQGQRGPNCGEKGIWPNKNNLAWGLRGSIAWGKGQKGALNWKISSFGGRRKEGLQQARGEKRKIRGGKTPTSDLNCAIRGSGEVKTYQANWFLINEKKGEKREPRPSTPTSRGSVFGVGRAPTEKQFERCGKRGFFGVKIFQKGFFLGGGGGGSLGVEVLSSKLKHAFWLALCR